MDQRLVFRFGGGTAEGTGADKALLGGKGAGLAEMALLGLPVPPGFTISTAVCGHFESHGGRYPAELEALVEAAIAAVETQVGRRFGDVADPLLFSVRSGARASMPGMMDTVLNLGLNSATVEGLTQSSGSRRFAFDAYRRFIAMYSGVVLDLKAASKREHDPFDQLLDEAKARRGVSLDTDLEAADLEALCGAYLELVRRRTGADFPEDPRAQLWGAIGAVFRSWNNPRALAYRRMYHIPADWGTAVNVQAMVFGNLGADCATGVAFTRDPATGERCLFGEFLPNAQGEDVVAGSRTPQPISRMVERPGISLEETMPGTYGQFVDLAARLERHFLDMQDLEFTVERGKLWMLQTRAGKRTGLAAIRIATDMVEEGLIDDKAALLRIEAEAMEHLLAPVFDVGELRVAEGEGRLLAVGLPAGPGAATGRVVFHADDAKAWAARGEPVILVRVETSPEDVGGMEVARGILTSRGGMTSHAALVARQRGKPCVVGCAALAVDYQAGCLTAGGRRLTEGDWLSLDGATGRVFVGEMSPRPSEVVETLISGQRSPEPGSIAERYQRVLGWADAHRRLGVRANADTPEQSLEAVALGAEGIGLTRTEHMFFQADRVDAMRRMIVAPDAEGRRSSLAPVLAMQRSDFVGIFRAMAGRPVTIRTLDPPLHEFLPHDEQAIAALAPSLGMRAEDLSRRIAELAESNPMLGLRGCRLGIIYPEITAMQARAILEAACELLREGMAVQPEIMIPLVGHPEELRRQREVVDAEAERVFAEQGLRVPYLVGTMIELPRAALCADAIARHAEFFSFGTNDLTQTTMGLSRDDAGGFLQTYIDQGILQQDPFQTLDIDGVGQLLDIGTSRGRATRPDLKVGICGEHGGDPASIVFAHGVGLDYVSCSPRRLPVARVAAAQAALGAGPAE
jgi:pyruvate,orthophosphate dikinase